MAKPAWISHVVYQTRRFDEMIDWYRNVFEARVVYENPALAFLTYDGEHHRLAIANLDVLRPDCPTAGATADIGVNHVAYTFETLGDLVDTYERLKAAGIEPYWPIHHGMTLSLYYQDPDGNRMEFQVEACSPAQAMALWDSEAFLTNPVGVRYDPDALFARFHAGEDEAVLLAQPLGEMSDIPREHGMT